MKQVLKPILSKALQKLGFVVTSRDRMSRLQSLELEVDHFLKLPLERKTKIVELIDKSKSQLLQDVFVLAELDFKRKGFFVEFGAANGIHLSNSYLLEKEFDWKGILAEPAKVWHDALAENRDCFIESSCVWTRSGEILDFNEVEDGELSTITQFNNIDFQGKERLAGKNYPVDTISLVDLLRKFNAPKVIDYLSIDTEGSEFEILSHFDFDEYKFRIITCEHNFTSNRDKIFDLLTGLGYKRRSIGLSKWDDWYVLTDF